MRNILADFYYLCTQKAKNMNKTTLIVAVAVLAAVMIGCRKAEPTKQLDKDETQGFVVAQELSNSRVQCIAEDAAGQLWIGTFRGLNRYDGHEYHQYFCADDTMGLPDNQIKGIPEDQKENIFKRYYQLDNQTKAIVNYGTGIGLYYSRRLAELHHGTLTVDNREDGEGAVFTFVWPMVETAYTDDERRPLLGDASLAVDASLSVDSNLQFASRESGISNPLQQESLVDSRPTILIVDDDTEIINYMRLLFAKDYRLITCLDADTALDEMRAEEPNLVLSDVAMPGKDGYELCQEIKQDIQLSHIPVILVTAKITAENQVEGLSVGADAYVTKPFDPAVLSALIQSQLKNRERVRKLLTKATTTEEEGVDNALSGQDKHFMEELYKLMEEELSNSELDVTRITKLLLISRTKLYYKIKGLTGETPSNFFRTYKLNREAELLKSGKYTVSEIADKCGFSTQSHFSVVFKKQFGVTPTEYKG